MAVPRGVTWSDVRPCDALARARPNRAEGHVTRGRGFPFFSFFFLRGGGRNRELQPLSADCFYHATSGGNEKLACHLLLPRFASLLYNLEIVPEVEGCL